MSCIRLVSSSGGEAHYEISGAIDEHTALDDVSVTGAEKFYIDMNKVDRINSIGIRNWIIWIKKNFSGKKMVFTKCPKHVMDQVNGVKGFLPSGSIVQSVYVPFFCEKCEKEWDELFVRGKDYENGLLKSSTELPCPSCGQPAEMERDEKKYFLFLKSFS